SARAGVEKPTAMAAAQAKAAAPPARRFLSVIPSSPRVAPSTDGSAALSLEVPTLGVRHCCLGDQALTGGKQPSLGGFAAGAPRKSSGEGNFRYSSRLLPRRGQFQTAGASACVRVSWPQFPERPVS